MTVARSNLEALTGLRFVAAATIVIAHNTSFQSIAAIGMPLFFTLSGFIIHYVYADAFLRRGRGALAEFAVARFSRIYPLYFVLLCLTLLHGTLRPSLIRLDEVPADLAAALAYVSAAWVWWPTTGQNGVLADPYFAISWSVSTEMFFYLCYALGIYRLGRIRRIGFCLASLAIFCGLAYLLFYVLFLTRDAWEAFALAHLPPQAGRTADFAGSFYRWLLYFSPYCRVFEFVGGVLTCQLFRLVPHGATRPSALAAAGIGLMLALFVPYCILGYTNPWLAAGNRSAGAFLVTLHMNFLLAPACYLLIFALAEGGTGLARILGSRLARFLGDISYSTYLSHPQAPRILQHLGLAPSSSPGYLVASLAVIYGMSVVLYRLVELPAKAWLRRVLEPRASAAATA